MAAHSIRHLRFPVGPEHQAASRPDHPDHRANTGIPPSLVQFLPNVATLLALVLIKAGFRRGLRPDHPLQRAHRVPYGVMLVDFAENVSNVTMLVRYPARHPGVARLAALLTLAKWLGFGVTVVLTLSALGLAAARLLTSRDTTSRS